jgi:DNA polymerase III epsilon subunit-like protein
MFTGVFHRGVLHQCVKLSSILKQQGSNPSNGDRIVEIGAVELINRSPTGQTFYRYLNPERNMPADALAVHGLTAEFLADKPAVC